MNVKNRKVSIKDTVMIDLNHPKLLAVRRCARRFPLLVLLAGLPSTSVPAQTLTTLYTFAPGGTNSSGAYTNADGSSPDNLILSGSTLYGVASEGGANGSGAVFAVNIDGTGFTNLYNFGINGGPFITASLLLSGNTLYGTTFHGGTNGSGTVFAVSTDGTGLTTLHIFTPPDPVTNTNIDGAAPAAGLILSGTTLYGTASGGGAFGPGTVFAINTDGTGFTNLHNFNFSADSNDGASPYGRLLLSSNTLYGTTFNGAPNYTGTVFALSTNGTGFTILHRFTPEAGPLSTNTDGASPFDGLVLSGNTLYGTAFYGGASGFGTVFAVGTDGTGFTNLHSFSGGSDGALPQPGLTVTGNSLYGTTGRSANGSSTMFAINTDGTGFTNLHRFTATSGPRSTNSGGAYPSGIAVLSGNTLLETTAGGGSSGNGTVFSLTFPPPQLTIMSSGTNVILTWPANVAGFSYAGYGLQSTPNLASPAVWATTSSGPFVANGQKTMTNPISGTQQFYRLSQ